MTASRRRAATWRPKRAWSGLASRSKTPQVLGACPRRTPPRARLPASACVSRWRRNSSSADSQEGQRALRSRTGHSMSSVDHLAGEGDLLLAVDHQFEEQLVQPRAQHRLVAQQHAATACVCRVRVERRAEQQLHQHPARLQRQLRRCRRRTGAVAALGARRLRGCERRRPLGQSTSSSARSRTKYDGTRAWRQLAFGARHASCTVVDSGHLAVVGAERHDSRPRCRGPARPESARAARRSITCDGFGERGADVGLAACASRSRS